MASELLRLFVAVYPPRDVAERLLASLRGLDLPAHRPCAPEQVHLTLQFIGDSPERELPGVIESVERACAGAAPLALLPRRVATLPERGPARLVAAMLEAPPVLFEVQRRLAQRLARRPGGRDRFMPHATLCRFLGAGVRARVDRPIEVGAFVVGEAVLVRSHLREGGAVHEPIRAFPLAPGDARSASQGGASIH